MNLFASLHHPFATHDATAHFSKSPKIVVVGAGLSGLTTAYRLHEKGENVEVYEARHRVGGRVFSVNVGGHIAELGGQNILDGGGGENILALIQELGLKTEEKTSLIHFNYWEDGEVIDIKAVLKERHFSPESLASRLQTLHKTKETMKEVLLALFEEQDPLYKMYSIMLSGYEGGPPEKLSSYYIQTLYHLLLGGLSAAHQNTSESETVSTDHLMIKGGNSLLTERLGQKLAGRLHLNHALVSISADSKGSYTLTFQNGNQVVADILILTMPCPVYKDINISDEVIPSRRRLNIEAIHYGTNAKILFPLSPLQSRPGAYSNGRVIAFDNRDAQVLNIYYVGSHGFFSRETLDDTFQKDLPFLNEVYGTTATPPPVIAADQAFALYMGPVGHSWPNDPFARGSYSYIGAGQEQIFTSTTEIAGEMVKTLFAPIENRLFFAGEHTSILLDVGGTMEAAVESGERTARLVEKLIHN